MPSIVLKIPFLIELVCNGFFILFYSFSNSQHLPFQFSSEVIQTIFHWGKWSVPAVILFVLLTDFLRALNFEEYFRRHVFSLVVLIPLLITFGDLEFCFWLGSAHLLSSVLTLYDRGVVGKEESYSVQPSSFVDRLKLGPAQIVLISFAALIALGTFLLMLPFSSATGTVFSPMDALFMATSATCVTGLETLSLADDFSLFGQIVILILIQIGGLGYMTLYSSMIILLGRSLGMENRIVMRDLLNVSSLEELLSMIVDIVRYTFFIELWGAILLTIGFTFQGLEFSHALYFGVFHSVSAFCNAGFSLFPDSLEGFATTPLIHGTVAVLVILGGLGFIVLRDIKTNILVSRNISRLGLHSKIVLVTSAFMIVLAALSIFFGEFLNALDQYSLWEKVQVSLFQAVTLRTAGFNTIEMTNLNTYTVYLMTFFMFIGAGSGSTAGGIKVTTFAILIQSITSTIKGRGKVEFFKKTIPNAMVVRATALTLISVMTTFFFILILMKLEPKQNFLMIFFEVVSASGTVGLSLGLTPFLSLAGKIGITLLMFIGRVGPLTLVLAIGESKKGTGRFSYPEGRIMIG